jgi:CHAD domain-containing protein
MTKEQFNEQAQDFIKHLQSFQEYLGSLSEDFVEEVSVSINGMEEELKDIIFEVENQISDEEWW